MRENRYVKSQANQIRVKGINKIEWKGATNPITSKDITELIPDNVQRIANTINAADKPQRPFTYKCMVTYIFLRFIHINDELSN